MKLGEQLLHDRLITQDQLDHALSEQRGSGGALGAVLVRLGYVSHDTIALALARRFGIESVDLDETPPDPYAAARAFAGLSRLRAAELRCCPVRLQNRRLTLAMAEPANVAIVDEVRARTGFAVEPVFATPAGILKALRSLGPRSRPRFPRARPSAPVDFVSGTDISTLSFSSTTREEIGPGPTKEARLADAVLVDGVRSRASAVHVELYWGLFRVRYRVEGSLRVVYQMEGFHDRLDPWAVIDRILLLAALDRANDVPQSRSFTARFESGGAVREGDYEVSFLPILYGARLVLRWTTVRDDLDEPLVPATEAEKNRALISAVRNGETSVVAELLKSGASPNLSSLLLDAARHGHGEIIELLLEGGADPRYAQHGLDPLMLASFHGHHSAVCRLLGSGAFDSRSGTFALVLAAREGHLDVVDELLRAITVEAAWALPGASLKNQAEVVGRLLKEVAPGDDWVRNALWWAAYTGAAESAWSLLDAWPETESLEPFVSAATEGAAHSQAPGSIAGRHRTRGPRSRDGHAAVVRKLLEKEALRRKLSGDFLVRALSEAVSSGSVDTMQAFLDAGANPNEEPSSGLSPLMAAIERKDGSAFELLLDAGAEVTLASLRLLGSPSRRGGIEILRHRGGIRLRPSDLLPSLRWASGEARDAYVDFPLLVDADELARQIVLEARRAAEREEETLDLSGLQLRSLPPALFEIDSFRKLDLANNELAEIPSQIGKLRKLEALDLSRNPLHSLPVEMSSLTRLRSLKMWSHRFGELPRCVVDLVSLEHLDISGCRLDSLPPELSRLPLRTLLSRFNVLTEFPEAVLRMPGLENLDLTGNRLTELPKAIAGLKHLRSLGLSGNPIRRLPKTFGELTLLEDLDLSWTGLGEVPPAISRLPKLRRLDLSHNRLKPLPQALFELPALEALELQGNESLNLKGLYRPVARTDFPQIPGYVVSPRVLEFLGLEILDHIHDDLTRESRWWSWRTRSVF